MLVGNDSEPVVVVSIHLRWRRIGRAARLTGDDWGLHVSVLLDRHDAIAVITLDDPRRRNAMSAAMGDALADACERLGGDRDVRAVVLTGSPPAFSAGGDLDMLDDLATRTRDQDFDARPFMRAFYRRFLALRELPVPVIAAINGHAIGAGLCVALACDIRIVAEDAKVGLNFSRLGLHPGMGATWLLPRLIGPQRAAEWLYTGRLLPGSEAAARGLAVAAPPAGEVLDHAVRLAAEIAEASPLVVRQLKATLGEVEGIDLDAALDREAEAQAVSYGTDDLHEGLAAARERRTPRFGTR